MKNSSQSKEKYQKKAEKQYELWKNNWEEYSNNVEEIIKIFKNWYNSNLPFEYYRRYLK